jgi:glucan 1,3-beta-glucosidase
LRHFETQRAHKKVSRQAIRTIIGMPASVSSFTSNNDEKKWIRGVNLGGWLVIERYIVPYQFSITDCHLDGDFCWFDGALSAPPTDSKEYKLCDPSKCKPVLSTNVFGAQDYPIDEWNLSEAFNNTETATRWLNFHFENFVKKQDLQELKDAGITHVRVPLPHWILGDIRDNEPWIAGDRWKYFKRMCGWAREIGLQVWPNIHTGRSLESVFCSQDFVYSNMLSFCFSLSLSLFGC